MPDYSIRDLTDYEELRTCVTIQERTWGPGFAEIVPAAILWVATRTGGVVAGAFNASGDMVGFVFGLSGYRDGQPMHWSDMLAVLPEARNAGLGHALKRHQRDVLLHNGIRDVFWTFDPLESRNAYLNFSRLGGVAREYIPDCYGASQSPLHAGLATDRLVVHWRLDSARVRSRMGGGDAAAPSGASAAAADVPLINEAVHQPRLDLTADRLRLRIPTDIQAIKATSPEQARQWRSAIRAALQTYLQRDYLILDLGRESADYSVYTLARGVDPDAALSR